MKQILKTICSVLLAASLMGCGGGSSEKGLDFEILATPTATVKIDNAWAVVTWNKVANAESYAIEVTTNGGAPMQYKSVLTSYSISMQAGSKYRMRVKALAGKNKAYVDSQWTNYLEAERPEQNNPTPNPEPTPPEPTDVVQLPVAEQDGVIRAFPGAEGGGMYTTGGRGGKVIHVTNLNDSGTGSLRAAVEQSGPRTIVFDVAGTIQLKSELRIKNGDLTIAGQTAPGGGVCLRDYSVVVSASNVIIRYMRFRMGDEAKHEGDAIWGRYYENIILDHCSMSWCTDECGSFYANKNFTMQWCLLGESLNVSVHGKGNHGYGGIWGGKNASFHHNLLASHKSRNPRFCHPQVYGNYLSTHRGNVDYRNNVVYNWGDNSTYGGEDAYINMVGNYYKAGPASKQRSYFIDANSYYSSGSTQYKYPRLYLEDNYHSAGYAAALNTNNWLGVYWHDGQDVGDPTGAHLTAPLPIKKDDATLCYTSTHKVADAFARVMDYVGASLKRDAVDTRLVGDARSGKATYTSGGNGSTGGIIDTQSAVGGWPSLTATPDELKRATTDTDGDSIPDYYEEKLGLDKSKADATAKTLDPQKLYSNFEIYLHYLVQEITIGQTAGATYKGLQ